MAIYVNRENEELISVELLKALWNYDPNTGIFTRLLTTGTKAKKGSTACTIESGYVTMIINGNTYRAHRLAWLYCFGEFPVDILDHINGVRDDNRLDNLRECTVQENSYNSKVKSDNTTGYKGVSLDKRSGRYRAYITVDGKQKSLGYHSSAEEASLAYNEAAKLLHSGFYKDISTNESII